MSSLYSEEDIKHIATLLDLNDTSRQPDLEKRLNDAASSFQRAKKKVDKAPRLSENRIAYSQVKECADKLLAVLHGLHEKQIDALNEVSHGDLDGVQIRRTSSEAPGGDRISVAKATLNDLLGSSEYVLANLPIDKGGRPKKEAIEIFVWLLVDIAKDFSSEKPKLSFDIKTQRAQGPFREFVSLALKPLDPHSDNSSLDRLVRESLRNL